jgi:hypothetical protein
MGLSRSALADLSGYSEAAIRQFEAGGVSVGGAFETTADTAFHRYKLVCAALTARLRFDWKKVEIDLTRRETVKIEPSLD